MIREPLRCCDGCKAEAADMAAAQAKAWSWLEISGRWRCPACARELAEVNAAHTAAEQIRDAGAAP